MQRLGLPNKAVRSIHAGLPRRRKCLDLNTVGSDGDVADAVSSPWPADVTPTEDAAEQPTDGISTAVNQAIFEELMDQLGDSDGEFRHELIDSYLTEGAEHARDAVAAASSRDAVSFGHFAHALRSTSALIGATTLADMLLHAEAVAREAPDGLFEVAGPISAEYSRVAASLALLDTGPSRSGSDGP